MKTIKTILKEIPKIQNMISNNGNNIPNQIIIRTNNGMFFQSYDTIIAAILRDGRMLLDKNKWDYSKTTSIYRNQFLQIDKRETERLIKEGKIKLVDLSLP